MKEEPNPNRPDNAPAELAERWHFEDTIAPGSYSKHKEILRPVAEGLKAKCLANARQTLAAYPKDNGATSLGVHAVDGCDIGLFCAVSLKRHGTAHVHFVLGSYAYAQWARAAALSAMGDSVVSTGFERYAKPL